MIANFSADGAKLQLDPQEYGFLHLALSYVLHGIALPDHDFWNILGMARDQAESLLEELQAAEGTAQRGGEHWNRG